MTTKAEREAAYQALVKLGVPIPPNEIDAVLEAAEGARGVAAAPMAEEVKRAFFTIQDRAEGEEERDLIRAQLDILSAHIDDLTRKVAESNELAQRHALTIMRLSRPQETDAVLAERESDWTPLRELSGRRDGQRLWLLGANVGSGALQAGEGVWVTKHTSFLQPDGEPLAFTPTWFRSRPSSGPATETERAITPEWRDTTEGGAHLYVPVPGGGRTFLGHVDLDPTRNGLWIAYYGSRLVASGLPTREEAQRALLASVRPKAEGV